MVDALSTLNLLEGYVSTFCGQLDTVILMPRLKIKAGGTVSILQIENDGIKIDGESNDFTVEKLLRDMNLLIEFLHAQLPSSVSSLLAEQLMPHLSSRLISNWLSLEVPTDIKEFSNFQSVLAKVAQFADVLDSYGWRGKDRLIEWSNQISHVWLNKRKETSLDKVRKLLAAGLGKSESVERVETRVLSREDDVFKAKSGDDGWNAEWSDEEGGDTGKMTKPSDAKGTRIANKGEDEEGEDVSAWGLADENTDGTRKENPALSDVGNDEADAWGWGDENEDTEAPQPANINGHHEEPDHTAREVTLKETYNITALPKEILEMITHLISDAETLRSPR